MAEAPSVSERLKGLAEVLISSLLAALAKVKARNFLRRNSLAPRLNSPASSPAESDAISGMTVIVSSLCLLMARTRGRDMQPAQPAAENADSGRVSGIQPQRMRRPLASSCDLGA